MKYWPIYLNLIRRSLALKGLTPTSPHAIDIIGEGWRDGLSALKVANLIIANEYEADEEAQNG